MKSPGERIRQARLAKGMTGKQLADKVGYKNQSAISNLENRAATTGGTKAALVAKALNVSADWLLDGPDSDTVPFLPEPARTPVLQSIDAATAQDRQHDTDWPFYLVTRDRLNRTLARLPRARAYAAINTMDQVLNTLLEELEREAGAANSNAA